jgi:hypothetical protein
MNQDKLNKLKNLAEILDAKKNGTESLVLLKKINDLKDEVSKLKPENLDANFSALEAKINDLSKQDLKLSKDTQYAENYFKNELATIKNTISNLKLKHGENGERGEKGLDGKDGVSPDPVEVAKIALEATEKLIKAIPPIEQEIVKNGESVRDSLELLKDDDRLSASAIKDLKIYDDDIATLQNRTQLLNQIASGIAQKVSILESDESNAEVNKIIAGTGITISPTTGIGDVTITNSLDLSPYVPYTGATTNVNLGTHSLTTTGDIRNNNSTNFSCFESGSLRIGNDPSPFPSSYIKFLYNTISNYLDVSDIGSANGVNFDVPIKVGALHSNGFLKTVGSDGSLTVDTSSYLKLAQATPQTFTSGTVTGTGLLQVVGGVLGKNVMITVSATAPANPNIGDLWVDLTE